MAARDDGYQAYNPREPVSDGPGPIGYVAPVIAWVAPGLGHFMIRERARGVVLGLTIYLLFAAGLFMGGIRAINPEDQPIWTYTQFLAGWPMLIANQLQKATISQVGDLTHRSSLIDDYNAQAPANPNETTAQREVRTKAFIAAHPLFSYHPKVQDMGSVFCGIAGMLNLLVIFDVILRVTGSAREDPELARRQRIAEINDAARPPSSTAPDSPPGTGAPSPASPAGTGGTP